jgi:hypothetical protein
LVIEAELLQKENKKKKKTKEKKKKKKEIGLFLVIEEMER